MTTDPLKRPTISDFLEQRTILCKSYTGKPDYDTDIEPYRNKPDYIIIDFQYFAERIVEVFYLPEKNHEQRMTLMRHETGIWNVGYGLFNDFSRIEHGVHIYNYDPQPYPENVL